MITPIKEYTQPTFIGLSTDTKPTVPVDSDLASEWNGAIFYEMNTGSIYLYNADAATWIKQ